MATLPSTNDTSTSGLFINLTELKPTTFLPFIERENSVAQLLNFNRTNYTVGNNPLEDLTFLCDEVSMDSQTAKVTQTAVYYLIMLLSLCGNSFLIAIFFKSPNMRSPIHHLITNMAISDLLVPVFVVPVKISEIGETGRWLVGGTLGSFLCKLSTYHERYLHRRFDRKPRAGCGWQILCRELTIKQASLHNSANSCCHWPDVACSGCSSLTVFLRLCNTFF